MSRSFKYLASAVVAVSLLSLLLAGSQSSSDNRSLQQERALLVARALAWVHQLESNSDDPSVEDFTQDFANNVVKSSEIKEVLVLKGTTYLAHSDIALAGKRLNKDSLSDKALYDSGARLKATVKKNIEERELNPELKRDAFPEFELELRDGDVREIRVPIMLDDRYRALSVAKVTSVPVSTGLPWTLLLLAVPFVGLAAVATWRLRAVPLSVAGIVIVIGMAFTSAQVLVDWRDSARYTYAQAKAQTLAMLVDAGLLQHTQATDRAELVDAVARPADGTNNKELATIFPEGKAPSVAEYHVVHAGGVAAAFQSSFFAEQRELDAGHLLLWALGFCVIGVLLFVLGSTGRLHRGWEAFWNHRSAYAYLSPAALGALVLVFVPVGFSVVLGFSSRRYNTFEFAGLSNYFEILSDFNLTDPRNFYFTLGVTFLWTILNVVLHAGIGLFLALLLNDRMLKAKGFFRAVLIIPWAVPNYITALIWRGMFHKQFGSVNALLEFLGIEPIAWWQSFGTSFATNLTTNVWLGFPFMMVVSLGALQSIPSDLYEAARVDGVNRWQRFRHITLPLLMPALVPAVMVGIVWTFNMFNIIYLVSAGAPDGATDILITEAYRWAFEQYRYGYAAAYSTVIFLILVVITLTTNRVTRATKGAYD